MFWLRLRLEKHSTIYMIKNAVVGLLLSLMITVPICGFVGGMIICTDCEGILDFILMGCIHAVLSTISFGRLYVGNTGNMESISLWPYIVPMAILFYVAWTLMTLRKR